MTIKLNRVFLLPTVKILLIFSLILTQLRRQTLSINYILFLELSAIFSSVYDYQHLCNNHTILYLIRSQSMIEINEAFIAQSLLKC